MSDNLDLVRSICADWERGDYSNAEWAHPEIEFVLADGPDPGRWIGRIGMWEGWHSRLGPFEDHRMQIDEFREVGDARVLVLAHAAARGKACGLDVRSAPGLGASVFHVRDGRVAELFVCWDRGRALADLGIEGQAVSQENVELVRRALRYVEEGDMTGVLSYCDERIEIEQAVEVPGIPARQHGHAGVLDAFAVWPDQWEDFSIEVLRVRDVADDVVVTMMNRGRGRETAIPVEAQFSHVFSIRDEKVVHWRIFIREEDALKAVGLEDQTVSQENVELVREAQEAWLSGATSREP